MSEEKRAAARVKQKMAKRHARMKRRQSSNKQQKEITRPTIGAIAEHPTEVDTNDPMGVRWKQNQQIKWYNQQQIPFRNEQHDAKTTETC